MQENRSLNEQRVDFPSEEENLEQQNPVINKPDDLKQAPLHESKQIFIQQQKNKTPINQAKQKKSKIFLIFFLIVLMLCGVAMIYLTKKPKPNTPNIQNKPTQAPQVSPSVTTFNISESHNSFGFDIFKKIYESDDKNSNIMISPSSIALALSMTYNGADEKTKQEMAQTLYLSNVDIEEVNKASNNLIQRLTNPDPKVEMAIANSIWARQGVDFKQNFYDQNTKYYQAEVQALDFSDNSAADTINDWVSENTNGKIPTIVEKPISINVVMYLINAIYFKGSWSQEFDKSLTNELIFTLADNATIKHPLMQQHRDDFNYLENDDLQAVSLPYGDNKELSMYVFLPKNNLNTLISELTTEKWKTLLPSFAKAEGTLLLPKFKLEYEKELSGILQKLGMVDAFSSSANFSKMINTNDIYISKVLHKTFIDVNEEGTEAAAATSVEMEFKGVMPSEEPFRMEVNKPFFYAIVDDTSSEILFMGVVKKPEI